MRGDAYIYFNFLKGNSSEEATSQQTAERETERQRQRERDGKKMEMEKISGSTNLSSQLEKDIKALETLISGDK
jgi:hypothetical protein